MKQQRKRCVNCRTLRTMSDLSPAFFRTQKQQQDKRVNEVVYKCKARENCKLAEFKGMM